MRTIRLFAAIATLSLALGACSTGYQRMGFTGGYEELRLSQDSFQISVRGNSYTSPEKAERIALLRACELTLSNGFERFVVVGGRGVQERHAGSEPIITQRSGNTYTTTGGEAITKPSGNIVIRMVARNDPAYASAMDASLIDAQLRPQLTR
jgi:hypothetical protein